jgi:hypothetical protein
VGGVWGFKSHKILKFCQIWVEFPVPWNIIFNIVIRIWVSFICKLSGTPDYRDTAPRSPSSLPSLLNQICWNTPPPRKYSWIRHWTGPNRLWVLLDFHSHIFQGSRHVSLVRSLDLNSTRLYPQTIFPVLISVRGWVDNRKLLRKEGLRQLKFPTTSSGNKHHNLPAFGAVIQTSYWVINCKQERNCLVFRTTKHTYIHTYIHSHVNNNNNNNNNIIIIFIYCKWVVTRWQWLLYTYFLTLLINLLREGYMRSM